MSTNAQYASTVKAVNGSIATSKINDRANGTSANLVSLYTPASANGGRMDKLRFSAQGSTTAAAQILLYKGASAATAVLFDEISVTTVTASNTSPAWGADYLGPVLLANGETLFAALSVSPGVAINYSSKFVGEF